MIVPARAAVALIEAYQDVISPMLPQACRFAPTCSEYARQVIGSHGAWWGGWLALKRLLRCHPFDPGGYDPPPSAVGPAAGERSDVPGRRFREEGRDMDDLTCTVMASGAAASDSGPAGVLGSPWPVKPAPATQAARATGLEPPAQGSRSWPG